MDTAILPHGHLYSMDTYITRWTLLFYPMDRHFTLSFTPWILLLHEHCYFTPWTLLFSPWTLMDMAILLHRHFYHTKAAILLHGYCYLIPWTLLFYPMDTYFTTWTIILPHWLCSFTPRTYFTQWTLLLFYTHHNKNIFFTVRIKYRIVSPLLLLSTIKIYKCQVETNPLTNFECVITDSVVDQWYETRQLVVVCVSFGIQLLHHWHQQLDLNKWFTCINVTLCGGDGKTVWERSPNIYLY